jgi:hypothetical protein
MRLKNVLSVILLSFVLTVLSSASQAQTSYGRISTDRISNKATIVIAGATPDVSAGNVFKTNNGSPTTITNFANGVDSHRIAVICGDTNTTIQNNSTIATSSGTDIVCLAVNQSQDFVYSLVQSKWIQKGRRSNVAQLPNTPLAFSATPSFAASFGASYSMTLTGNVTSSTITGTPSNGNILSLTLTEDATGGRTFAFPGNFIFTPSFSFTTAANAINELTFKFDGTDWHMISNGSGGSGCTPGGSTNGLRKNNAGGCSASGANDDGTTPTVNRNALKVKGPNPYVDVTAFGVRAPVGGVSSTTGGISSGSPTLTLAAASTFINGDGIVIRGAGPTLTVATPAAPTVVASNAQGLIGTGVTVANSSGSTTYQYCVAARTPGGGMTPCSPTATITNGAATLGKGTTAITSWTKAAGGVVTVNLAAAHNMVNGSLVNITGDSTIAGWYQVATATPGTSVFTFIHGNLTENGAATSGGSTGSVVWFNGNHITWPTLTGAYQYLIYNVGTGALVGVSLPDPVFFAVGGFSLTTDPLYNNFDDFGSPITTAPGQPDWVPTGAPPSVAKNEDLVTTIVSGAGTTTLTLAANAVNTVAGATVKFDNTPNIRAAILAVFPSGAQGGVLYFPATPDVNTGYITNSYLNLSSGTFPAVVGINQAGPIFPQDTIQIGSIQWTGWPHNPIKTTSFAAEAYPRITSSVAYPMIYAVKPNSISLAYLSIENNNANAGLNYLQDAGGFANTFDHLNFMSGGGSGGTTDFSSRHMIFRNNISNAAVFSFSRIAMIAGGPQISDNSPVPVFQVTQGFSPFSFDHIFLNRRGIYLGAETIGTQGTIDFIYEQGAIMPKITLANTTAGIVNVGLEVRNSMEDTTTQPTITYFGNNQVGIIRFDISNGLAGNATVNGPGSIALQMNAVGNPNGNVGQNQGLMNGPNNGAAIDGIISNGGPRPLNIGKQVFSGSYSIGSRYQFFVDSLPQQAPTCSVSAGGTVPIASYTFRVAPVFPTGGEGSPSAPSLTCTTTGGNQTVTVNWTTVLGAIGYDIYKNTGLGFFPFQCAAPWVSGGGTTAYVWTGTSPCGAYGLPTFTGSGPTSLSVAGVSAPRLTLASTDGGGMVNVKMPVGTATRTLNLPDATGTALLATGSFTKPNHLLITRADGTVQDFGVAPMAVFDSGNRANGTIQSGNPNWVNHANFSGGVNVVGNSFVGVAGGTTGWVLYTGASFPTDDQTVAATITGVGASANASTSILLRASPTVSTGYSCSYSLNGTSNLSIGKEVAGTFTSLSSMNYSAVAGDKLSCNVTGTTLNLYVNGVRKIGPITDTSISSGFPGLGFFSNLSSLSLSNWAASYGAVSLNVAQTWNAIQNFSTGIQLNGSNTLSSVSGNSGRVGQTTGTLTNLHLASFDANGNIVDSGVTGMPPCTALRLQFNHAGAFGCMANFTFTAATGVLTHNQLANGNELLFGKRFTDTTPTGNFIHYQTQASTDIFKLDVNGNLSTRGGISTGSTAPACTPGTAGSICLAEGTDATNASGAAVIDANSTTHELAVKTNGSANAGMLVRTQPGAIHQTAQTAAITTATLCAASAGACNVAGQYHVHFDFIETGTACSNVTAGSVTFLLTWTDSNATAHSAVVVPMLNQTGATSVALGNSFTFATALANAGASGDFTISTNGSVIQYATGYTGCTTGTGTYRLDAAVTRLQ